MQPYDFLMIAILVGLTLYGYSKGMAWQVAYLASLIASYFVALRFADQFAPMFGDSAPFNKFVAMLVIYIVTSLGIWMVFRVVRGGIDRVKLQGFDHQMGALVGFARGVLWCVGITFFAVTLLPTSQKESIVRTRSGRAIAMLLDKTDAVVPPEVHDVIGPVIDRVQQGMEPAPGPGAPQGGAPQGWPSGPTQPSPGGGWPSADVGPSTQWPQRQDTGWPEPGDSPRTSAQPTGWPQ